MKEKRLLSLLIFLITFSFSAQVKGVVLDSISGKPIAYVNIWVENENIGTTSEENGIFSLDLNEEKSIIFSALGYETKNLKSSEIEKVSLYPKVYEMPEVVLENKKETKKIQIGKVKGKGYYSFYLTPSIHVKYFSFEKEYKELKFLKLIEIQTKSEIDSVSLKIKIFNVNDLGFPEEDLLKEDLIVYVKKGKQKTKIDISSFNITFPEKGIFVGYENMIIKRNQKVINITDIKTEKTRKVTTHFPYIFHNFVEEEQTYIYYYGEWFKQEKYKYRDSSDDLKTFQPAINITLTN